MEYFPPALERPTEQNARQPGIRANSAPRQPKITLAQPEQAAAREWHSSSV